MGNDGSARNGEAPDEPQVRVVDKRWWARANAEAEATADLDEGGWRPGKPTYVEELEQQLAERDRQVQELTERFRAAAREFEESRARLRRDVAKEVERGRRTMLAELLEIVDNLDRAIEASRQASSVEGVREGVELVHRQFLARLEGFGVKRLEAVGLPFDPTRHEALTTVPVDAAERDGLVEGVVRPGYLIGDEVLRPAAVAVARFEPRTGHAESAAADGGGDGPASGG